MVQVKASLNLRAPAGVYDSRKPLLNAKVMANLLGFPIFTGISFGDASNLALRFGTVLQGAGKAFEIVYRPNEPSRPFSVTVRAGFGPWCSSNAMKSLYMATDFDLSRLGSPVFRFCIKPQAGNFSFVRKFHSTSFHIPEGIKRERAFSHLCDSVPDFGFTNCFARSPNTSLGDSSPITESTEKWARNGRAALFAEEQDLSGGYDWENVTVRRSNAATSGDDHILWTNEHDRCVPLGETSISGSWERLLDKVSNRGRSPSPASQQEDGNAGEAYTAKLVNHNTSETDLEVNSFLGGGHLRVYSSLPVSSRAKLKVRWQTHAPLAYCSKPFTIHRLPLLVLDKVSFEASVVTSWITSLFGRIHGEVRKPCPSSYKALLHSMQEENNAFKTSLNAWKGNADAEVVETEVGQQSLCMGEI